MTLAARISDLASRVASEIKSVRLAMTGYALSGHAHTAATTSSPGFLSAEDKLKLDGLESLPLMTATSAIQAFDTALSS